MLVFAGDINLYFKPTVFKKFNFVVQSGCGYRHLNDTQVLVNGDYEIYPLHKSVNGFGIKAGLGLDYPITENYNIAFKYIHDFYMEGFDYFGLNFGIVLK
jgi:hypothetical protein